MTNDKYPMPHHTHYRHVEFHETDMAGLVHFSNFFRWMEAAEADFFRHLGEPMIHLDAHTVTGWPRVRASCRYHAPLCFGDEICVLLTIKELKIRAIEYGFRFEKNTPEGPLHCATGEMTTVFAKRTLPGQTLEAAAIPPQLQHHLEALLRPAS